MTGRKSRSAAVRPRAVRVYEMARSVHLERLAESPGTVLLYRRVRYDFHPDLLAGVDAHQVTRAGALRYLLRHPADIVEVTEPGFLPGVRLAALAVLGSRVGRLLARRPRASVVSYAIGNSDPRAEASPSGARQHLGLFLNMALARYVMSQLDRVAFGTSAARDTYRDLFRWLPRRQSRTVILDLPAPCETCRPRSKVPGSVVFLGAFSPRKGFNLLLDAWRSGAPDDASLTLVGKGTGLADAERLAAEDHRVSVVVDPTRAEIHEILRAASVLTLPSQPSKTWREQVGLPIVEGLQHGCTIVTTDETGIADWLGEHDHTVIPGASLSPQLNASLIAAVANPLAPDMIFDSLPRVAGRLSAEHWMYETSRDQ